MQLIDPTAVLVLLVIVGIAAVAAVALAAIALPGTLSVTRRERLRRHESIPAFYGRLHFAG